MTLSLITLKQNELFEWMVVKTSFPNFLNAEITLPVTNSAIKRSFKDQKSAEIAAKKFSEANQLAYVPQNGKVITAILFNNSYLPVELSLHGGFVVCGKQSFDIWTARVACEKKAQEKNLTYIRP